MATFYKVYNAELNWVVNPNGTAFHCEYSNDIGLYRAGCLFTDIDEASTRRKNLLIDGFSVVKVEIDEADIREINPSVNRKTLKDYPINTNVFITRGFHKGRFGTVVGYDMDGVEEILLKVNLIAPNLGTQSVHYNCLEKI